MSSFYWYSIKQPANKVSLHPFISTTFIANQSTTISELVQIIWEPPSNHISFLYKNLRITKSWWVEKIETRDETRRDYHKSTKTTTVGSFWAKFLKLSQQQYFEPRSESWAHQSGLGDLKNRRKGGGLEGLEAENPICRHIHHILLHLRFKVRMFRDLSNEKYQEPNP